MIIPNLLADLGIQKRDILDTIGIPIIVFNKDLIILEQNSAHASLTRTRRADIVGRFMFDVFPPAPDGSGSDTEAIIKASIARVQQTRQTDTPPIQRHDLKNEAGHYIPRFWEICHAPIVVNDEIVAFTQVSKDVTSDQLAAKLAKAQRDASNEAASVSFFTYDLETDVVERGPDLDAMFGLDSNDSDSTATAFFKRVLAEDLSPLQSEIFEMFSQTHPSPRQFNFRIEVPNQPSLKFIRVRGEIVVDPVDLRRKLVGVALDMTKDVEIRLALESALEAKEALLVEVNHRVKNSLQITSSLLRMQSSASHDDALKTALGKAVRRVQAIAEVHGALYMSTDVMQVNVVDLIKSFISAFGNSLDTQVPPIKLSTPHEGIWFSTQSGIYLGLILNELVTNAVKYGDQHPAQNHIEVTVTQKDNCFTVWVESRTRLTPADVTNMRESTGVGAKIIDAFARQLGGEVRVTNESGVYRTTLSIALPAGRG